MLFGKESENWREFWLQQMLECDLATTLSQNPRHDWKSTFPMELSEVHSELVLPSRSFWDLMCQLGRFTTGEKGRKYVTKITGNVRVIFAWGLDSGSPCARTCFLQMWLWFSASFVQMHQPILVFQNSDVKRVLSEKDLDEIQWFDVICWICEEWREWIHVDVWVLDAAAEVVSRRKLKEHFGKDPAFFSCLCEFWQETMLSCTHGMPEGCGRIIWWVPGLLWLLWLRCPSWIIFRETGRTRS